MTLECILIVNSCSLPPFHGSGQTSANLLGTCRVPVTSRRRKSKVRRPLHLPDGLAHSHAEKSSWLSLSRGTSGADPWRSASCKLLESEEGTTLHVYLDVRSMHLYPSIHLLTRARQNTVLYASMYVHALKHTDIRVVHRSLFERKDCLGIYWGTYVPLPCALPCEAHE